MGNFLPLPFFAVDVSSKKYRHSHLLFGKAVVGETSQEEEKGLRCVWIPLFCWRAHSTPVNTHAQNISLRLLRQP